tara:strand:- start:30563 stop:32299 length:1737 start_codon:yes stop_codon:yes gene_type:complete
LKLEIDTKNISNTSRIKSLYYIINYLPYKYRINLVYSIILVIFAGILEALSIRFIRIILDQIDVLKDIEFINNFSQNVFLLITFILTSTLLRLIIIKFNLIISAITGNYLSSEIFKELAERDYELSLNDKESVDIDLITWQVTKASGLINIFLQTISSLFISIFISISIFIESFNLIFFISLLLLCFYSILGILIKKRLRKNSKTSLEVNRFCVKSIQEVSVLRTEINLGLNSRPFIKDFKEVDLKGKKSNADSQFLALIPRYLIEGLVFSIGILILYLSFSQQNLFISISSIGTLAFALQKILPNIQQIFYGWSCLNAQGDSLIEVNKALRNLKKNYSKNSKPREDEVIKLKNRYINPKWKKIKLENISYSYFSEKGEEFKVYKDFFLTINNGDKIAIYGQSGTGKSTLIKLISGLLKPQNGEILIDGENINLNYKNLKDFRNLIAYVPQQVQILNRSIKENLLLDSNLQISTRFFNKVIKSCYLENFINSKPSGLETTLGFRGQSISGGQKQRIAIARAIIKKKQILILDEATSSLDRKMEKEILFNIHKMLKDTTIIHITHNPEILNLYERSIKI